MSSITPPRSNSRKGIREWLLRHSDISTESLATLSGLSVRKITEWKIKHDVIDIKDRGLFTAWIKFKDYTTHEAALALGITLRSLRYHLNKYGITKYKKEMGQLSTYKLQRNYKKLDKSLLKNQDVLRKLYKWYGCRALSKIFGVSRQYISRHLKLYDIIDSNRKFRPHHDCNNKEWLMKNYVEMGKNLAQCAEEAGVNDETIAMWLIGHGIRPRDSHQNGVVFNGDVDPIKATVINNEDISV